MKTKTDIQHNKLIHLEDTMDMYGVYNAETLEKLINTVHHMHNTKTLHENYLQDNLPQHTDGILIHTVIRVYNILL